MKKYLLTAATTLLMLSAGAQWVMQNAGFKNDTLGFYEMSIPSKKTAWAVCFDIRKGLGAGRFLLDFTRTTDGGVTWIPGKMGNDHTMEFSNISAINGKEAWVAMNKRFQTGGGLFHTTDGGVTWQKSNPTKIFDENSFPDFVYFKDKSHGIAMGDPNGGYFEVYTTNNKGKKWKRVPQADLPASLLNEYGFACGYAAVNNTVWFGTTSGRMYKSKNFGKKWSVYTVDPAGKFVNEIAFNDDRLHGVAHLRDNSGNTFLFSTANGGVTWVNLGQPANWKSSRITSVPGTNALISTGISNNPNFIGSAISYDNGTTWTEIERAVNKTVARFYDATTGYACGYFATGPPFLGGIYKSQIVFPGCGQNVNHKQSVVEIQPREAEVVKIFPSPANDVVTISFSRKSGNAMHVIGIIDVNGKILQTRKITGNQVQMDVSKFLPGTYFIRITGGALNVNKVITIVR